MEIRPLNHVSDDTLTRLDTLANECEPGKYSLVQLRDMATNKKTDILYLLDEDEPIYFTLLDIFPKHKTIYIHDVCASKSHRGKGLFKKSLTLLKKHYAAKGYTFTLDASHRKKGGLDQKARIHIFHSAGFDINPETGYFTQQGEYKVINTRVILDTKEKLEIQKRVGDTYHVTDDEGKTNTIDIGQIEQCLDAESKQISCPMIMAKRAHRRTRRKSRGRKTRRR